MRFDCLEASHQLIRALRGPLTRLRHADRKLYVQLRTALASIPLNIAEGRGRQGGDKKHHWCIAHGSAEEVGAILDAAEAFGDLRPVEHQAAKETLTRVLQMLWRMTH
jgi:four helix bundle protein